MICQDCKGKRYSEGLCDGLIEVGVGYSGIPVYEPCPARSSLRFKELTNFYLQDSRANVSTTTHQQLTVALANVAKTLLTRAHASCTKYLVLSTSLDFEFKEVKAAVNWRTSEGSTPGCTSTNKQEVTQLPSSDLIQDIQISFQDSGLDSKLLTLSNQSSQRTLRSLTALTSLLGFRSLFLNFNELCQIDWWHRDPRIAVPETTDILFLGNYDGEGLLPEWVLQPIVSLLDQLLEEGRPMVVSFWKSPEKLVPRYEFEELLIDRLQEGGGVSLPLSEEVWKAMSYDC